MTKMAEILRDNEEVAGIASEALFLVGIEEREKMLTNRLKDMTEAVRISERQRMAAEHQLAKMVVSEKPLPTKSCPVWQPGMQVECNRGATHSPAGSHHSMCYEHSEAFKRRPEEDRRVLSSVNHTGSHPVRWYRFEGPTMAPGQPVALFGYDEEETPSRVHRWKPHTNPMVPKTESIGWTVSKATPGGLVAVAVTVQSGSVLVQGLVEKHKDAAAPCLTCADMAQPVGTLCGSCWRVKR